ncbi:hypothetical protein CANARDRAFT_8837 [[Candida] arabinofermentans NRRL YB-2248]|uniref:Uncharacterized protein n=1 Tax=[Candida] arabinofermentans NRRL YB-2248 TaxID=983967 RepID=A0A1E4SXC9_9ASCO|nr:hypothetical protein CANARDRAFT_8837 [[Candida] arabinofermentans NRRL YB-2248]
MRSTSVVALSAVAAVASAYANTTTITTVVTSDGVVYTTTYCPTSSESTSTLYVTSISTYEGAAAVAQVGGLAAMGAAALYLL